MAAYPTVESTLPASPSKASSPALRTARRRITPQADRASETLNHAIEYLLDQLVHERAYLFEKVGQLDAVQLLKAANRQVHSDRPVESTIRERFRAWLRQHAA